MLSKAANAADDAAADVRKQGQTLVSNMISEASSFTSPAGTAFRTVLGDLMDDVNRIILDLENMANAARQTSNELFGQDDTNAANFKKIHAPTGVTGGLSPSSV
jgi:uncharacterized cupredoxin-like copper-binding protein